MGEVVNAITLPPLSKTDIRKSTLEMQRREQEFKAPAFRPKSKEV